MKGRTFNIVGGAGGVVYLISAFAGIGIAPTGDFGASKDVFIQLAADATANPTRFYLSGYIQVIGLLFFLAFAARLWGTFRRAEGDPGWLSTAALAGALVFSVLHLVAAVAWGPIVLRADEGIDPEVAVAFGDLSLFLRWVGEAVLALFFAGSAVVILGTQVFARWLGWIAAVIALALVVTVPMVLTGIPHIPATLGAIWIAYVGVLLIVRPGSAAPSASDDEVS